MVPTNVYSEPRMVPLAPQGLPHDQLKEQYGAHKMKMTDLNPFNLQNSPPLKQMSRDFDTSLLDESVNLRD